jgi:hypothetical protein
MPTFTPTFNFVKPAHLEEGWHDQKNADWDTVDAGMLDRRLADAAGDTLYATGPDTWVRLPIGTPGEVYTVVAGVPSWEPVGAATHPNWMAHEKLRVR